MCDTCRPIADVVDLAQRGVTIGVDSDDLVTDVVVIVKAITPEGDTYVVQGCSDGTDWVTESALVAISYRGGGVLRAPAVDDMDD